MSNTAKYVLTGVLGLGTGIAIGYFSAKHSLEKRYDEMLDFEVQRVKEFYGIRAHREETEREEAAIEDANSSWVAEQAAEKKKLLQELMDNNYTQEEQPEQSHHDKVEQLKSIWDEGDGEQKSPPRNPDMDIFVITFNEFQYEEDEHDKVSVQFFEADGTLCDETDTPYVNHHENVGTDFDDWFGWESGNPHIVHVRNRRLKIDYEIARNVGSYVEIVHGLPDEEDLHRRPNRMRDDD